jgi:putative endonuclease
MKATKEIGDFGERLAVHFLRRRGYIVRERNLRVGHAEVDIVATTLRDVVFVEVKTRSYDADKWRNAPPPSLAVHAEKQRLTRTAASVYLHEHPTKKRPRMDVIEVWLAREPDGKRPRVLKIHHIKAAY